MRCTEEEETKSEKDFVSAEAKDIWNRLLADKGFVSERGFGKLISPFSEIIEKNRLGVLLCTHGAWIRCSGQGILCKHGGNKRRLNEMCEESGYLLGTKESMKCSN